MKKFLMIAMAVGGIAFLGSASTAQAFDHWHGGGHRHGGYGRSWGGGGYGHRHFHSHNHWGRGGYYSRPRSYGGYYGPGYYGSGVGVTIVRPGVSIGIGGYGW